MKITPIAQGTGQPGADLAGVSLNAGTSADKIARAKAIMNGESPLNVRPSENNIDPQVERVNRSPRRMKMTTNYSPDRAFELPPEPAAQAPAEAAPEAQNAISDATEQTDAGLEVTKPLSPQFAALAKQRRALQVKERELQEREKALEAKATSGGQSVDLMGRLKSEPLRVLEEAGVSYDDLTQAILGNAPNPEIAQLKAEIKALKEGVDKNLADRDTQAEQQVLREIKRDADSLVAQDDNFELVRAMGYSQKAVDLIHRTWKETGEVMEVHEALTEIENALFEDQQRILKLKKFQAKPQEPVQPETPNPQPQGMRTLTNRDNARPLMDRRARAIAAALGQLKR